MTRILITGITGFVGARVAFEALQRGYQVKGLVRNWGWAARVARHPVTLVSGDVLDVDSIRAAMAGCDLVVHAATDYRARGEAQYRSIVEGTRNVMTAASELGVRRVLHVSSAGVHGLHPPAGSDLPETLLEHRTGIPYCDGKIQSEIDATGIAESSGLPLVIVRPTIVYGPWGTHNTIAVNLALENRLVLVDGARGRFNGIYVDNVAWDIMAALEAPQAAGRILHLGDEDDVTWRAFLELNASAIDPAMVPLRQMNRRVPEPSQNQEAAAGGEAPALAIGALPNSERTLRAKLKTWWLSRRKIPTTVSGSSETVAEPAPAPSLNEFEISFFRLFDQVTFPMERTRSVLGNGSRVTFAEGMARTAKWIKWANVCRLEQVARRQA